MNYLLDTNICIYIINQKPADVLQKFQTIPVGSIAIATVTVAELQCGAEKSQRVSQNKQALEQFLLPLIILPFDHPTAIVYGRIRTNLEKTGTPIGSLDMLIAAQALSHNLTIVTNNEAEFNRVPELRVENWV